MSKIQEILNGWANVIRDELNTLPQEIKDLSSQRLTECDECPLRDGNTCSTKKKGLAVKDFVYKGKLREKDQQYSGCGCNLAAKTKSITSVCPLGKW